MAYRGRGGLAKRAKPDAVAVQIVARLRELGAAVHYIESAYGKAGIPDLIVGWLGVTYLLELKSPGGRLSDAQEKFRQTWTGGPILTVRTLAEALVGLGMKESMAC